MVSTTMIIITTRDMISDIWLPTNSVFFSSLHLLILSFIHSFKNICTVNLCVQCSWQWLPICFWEMLIILVVVSLFFPLIQLRKRLSMKHTPAPNEILWDFFLLFLRCFVVVDWVLSFLLLGNWRCCCAFEIDWIIKWWNKDAWMNPINECSGE